jgi:hypothetical protein
MTWSADLQWNFNHVRRNGATVDEMAETLKLPIDAIIASEPISWSGWEMRDRRRYITYPSQPHANAL